MTKQGINTSDLYFCAALLAMGAKLESVDKSDTRHMIFEVSMEVSGELGLLDCETQWANDELMVSAVKMAEAIKRLKSVVHSK